jgi:cytidylate kinase
MDRKKEIITIDGPSGVGKSTVAKALASRLGYRYLDTGAMYRAITLAALQAGLTLDPPDDEELVALLGNVTLALDEDGVMLLNGTRVDDRLRDEQVTGMVSAVSAVECVRSRMVELQRTFAGKGRFVAEGRDLGSVVFPRAAFKFFLDADPVERARRRAAQLEETRGSRVPEEAILKDQERRDRQDASRSLSPLKRSEDMIRIDTTHLSVEDVLEQMIRAIQDPAA